MLLGGAILWLTTAGSPARAGVDIETDVSASREFLWMTTDASVSLWDDTISVGAGVAVASDYARSRAGLRLQATVERERWSAGIAFSWAPPQARGGWVDAEPHASIQWSLGHAAFEAEARIVLRHIDVAGDAFHLFPVEELRLQAEISCSIDPWLRLSLLGAAALYDRDLSSPSLAGADLGPAVAFAGRPERYAGELRVGHRFHPSIYAEIGLIGLEYADRGGGALVPRASIKVGPLSGMSFEPLVEVAIGVGAATGERRVILGLSLGFGR